MIGKMFGKLVLRWLEKANGGHRIVTTDDLVRELREGDESITPNRAMQCAVVFACVRVLSESLAQLPLHLYRRKPGGKERVTDHPLVPLLHDGPNRWQTSMEFREYLMASLLLRGNGYAWIGWADSGARRYAKELTALEPDRVQVKREDDWSLTYKIYDRGQWEPTPAGNILHVRGLSLDGVSGVSPITYARNAIGLALATESHGRGVFKHGARPGGILKTPNKLGETAYNRLKESWEAEHGGEKQGGTAILEEGLEYQAISMNAQDAQYLETRKYQRSEIAGLYRVPLHMINDLERATFSNVEHLSLEFVKFSLLPWLVRWEQALMRCVFSPEQRAAGIFPEFQVAGLERGDIGSRYKSYQIGILGGFLTRNEARAFENLNPIEGADELLQPTNMIVVGDLSDAKTGLADRSAAN